MSQRFVIVAALDLNTGSSAVLERALELASSRPGGEVHAVTVAEPELPVAMYLSAGVAEAVQPAPGPTAEFCRAFIAARQKQSAASFPPVHVHSMIGSPADEIVWLAAYLDAELIVLSTHGRRGVKRVLLGSVAEKVVRLAGCPVFVVRPKQHDAAWRVPEIEPLCPDCAVKRSESGGKQLWCARHSEHHVRAHILHYSSVGEDPPHAWSSSTGT